MLKCSYCGTGKSKSGKPFAHQGALNLHEAIHCPMRAARIAAGGQQPGPHLTGSGGGSSGVCCSNPCYRFLSRTNGLESMAMRHGYKKICETCEEVL